MASSKAYVSILFAVFLAVLMLPYGATQGSIISYFPFFLSQIILSFLPFSYHIFQNKALESLHCKQTIHENGENFTTWWQVLMCDQFGGVGADKVVLGTLKTDL